jgi:hypothetical protein
MCQSAESTDSDAGQTPDVEFHVDDFQYGYFPPQDRADTMMSDECRVEGNIGELVMKLDSLDDFFEDSLHSPTSDGRSSRTITEFGGETFESGAQLYDEQTLPILHQSLGDASNSTSFQNGFADNRPAQPQYMLRESSLNAMNPGAFNVAPSTRPNMHARSVTSPSAPASSSQTSIPDFISDDEYTEEVFSDGDDERPPVTGEGSFFLENMIRPLAQGTRSGMRRLTGGRSRDNDRQREILRAERRGLSQPPKSPQVPRVPSVYLQTPMPQVQQRPQSPPDDSL